MGLRNRLKSILSVISLAYLASAGRCLAQNPYGYDLSRSYWQAKETFLEYRPEPGLVDKNLAADKASTKAYTFGFSLPEVDTSSGKALLKVHSRKFAVPDPFPNTTFLPGDKEKLRTIALGPGLPLIPVHNIRLAMPQGKIPYSIRLYTGDGVEVTGKHELASANHPRPVGSSSLGVKEAVGDPHVYGSDEPFPAQAAGSFRVHTRHGVNILSINVYPVSYRPLSGKIIYYPLMRIEVDYQPASVADELNPVLITPRRDNALRDLAQFISNQKELDLPQPQKVTRDVIGDYLPPGNYEYVIITKTSLRDAFSPLLAHKQGKGLSARMVTLEEDIEPNYSGTEGGDLPDRIRHFIRDAYLNWGTRYVLLGGDQEVIPKRGVFAEVSGEGTTYTDVSLPTDEYFACLDGPWNGDSDELWGEGTDGVNGGDIDLAPEVYVGRAPVSTVDEVSAFVQKTILYETTMHPNWNKVVLLGEQLDESTQGSYSSKLIRDYALPPSWNYTELYDEVAVWGKETLISSLNQSPHLVDHLGHAGPLYNARLLNSDVRSITNTHPFFIYSQGCESGDFERYNVAISEQHLFHSHAAVGVLMNTRYGWYVGGTEPGCSFYHAFYFWYNIFKRSVLPFAEVNQRAKEDNLWLVESTGVYRWIHMETMLFGDPETSFDRGPDLTPPSAQLLPVNKVQDVGTGAVSIRIKYSDDRELNPQTIDSADVVVRGLGGFETIGVFVNLEESESDSEVVAVYQVYPQGDSWQWTDNGDYSVYILPDAVSDLSGNAVNSSQIGVFQVDLPDVESPQVEFSPLSAELNSKFSSVSIELDYSDNDAIDLSTLGQSDLSVSGPGQPTKVQVSFEPSTIATRYKKVTYTLSPSLEAGWRFQDNGIYTVNLVSQEVKDVSGNGVVARALGEFKVAIPQEFVLSGRVLNEHGELQQSVTVISESHGDADTDRQGVFSISPVYLREKYAVRLDSCYASQPQGYSGTVSGSVSRLDFQIVGCSSGCVAENLDSEALTNQSACHVDSDGDGLSDKRETILGTNPKAFDSDKDGASDGEEVTFQTNPLDRGSSAEIAGDEVCSEWNGFLGPMANILEHTSFSEHNISLKTRLFSLSGDPLGDFSFKLARYGKFDVLVHDLFGWQENSYGRVCSSLESDGKPLVSSGVGGGMVFYKYIDESSQEISFAFMLPFSAGRMGKQYLSYNTFQPSLNVKDELNPVYNWIQVSNLESSQQSGTLIFYDQEGAIICRRSLKVGANKRQDLPAHAPLDSDEDDCSELGPAKVGIVEWVPEKEDAYIQIRNVRYFPDNNLGSPSFQTAFQLAGQVGNGEVVYAPVDTRNQSSIVELLNTASVEQRISFSIFSSSGELKETGRIKLKARSSSHLILDGLLPNSLGSIRLQPSEREGLIAVVMQYGRHTDNAVRWMYGNSAQEGVAQEQYGAFNTFLGQGCQLLLTNPVSREQGVRVIIRDRLGKVLLNNDSLVLAAFETKEMSCAVGQPNSYGSIKITGSEKIIGTILRLGSEDRYRFSTPLQRGPHSSLQAGQPGSLLGPKSVLGYPG